MFVKLIVLTAWLIAGCFAYGEGTTTVSNSVRAAVTKVGQLYRLGLGVQRSRCTVQLDGVVCRADPGRNRLIVEDDSGAIWVKLDPEVIKRCQPGMHVRVAGRFSIIENTLVGRELVENDGVHGVIEQSGSAYFKAGRHPIRVAWFNFNGDSALDVLYQGPNLPKQKIPDSALYRIASNKNNVSTNWEHGLEYRSFEGQWEQMPPFDEMVPATRGLANNFDISFLTQTNGGMEFTGFVELPEDGEYTFFTASDDGSKLWAGTNELEVLDGGQTRTIGKRRSIPGEKLTAAQWGGSEGTVRFVSRNDLGAQVELESDQGRMMVQILGADSAQLMRYFGKRVRIDGLVEPMINEQGDLVAARMWVPDCKAISLDKLSLSDWLSVPAYSIRTLTATHAGKPAKALKQYSLTSANDYPSRDPKRWKVMGSNDGDAWTMLDERHDETFENRFEKRVYTVTNVIAYNVYRLQIDLNAGIGPGATPSFQNDMIQLAEIELAGSPELERDFESDTEKIISAAGDFPPAETKEMAFDGKTRTKWLDRKTNSWIQVQYAWLTIPSNRVIRVSGRVIEQAPDSVVLGDDYGRLRVRCSDSMRLPAGQEVEAIGFLFGTGTNAELTGAYVQPGNSSTTAQLDDQFVNPPVMTNVVQLLRLGRGEQTRNLPIQLRGVITCLIDAGERNYRDTLKTFQDATGGICIHWGWDGSVKPGDVIQLSGHVEPWAETPIIVPEEFEILATGNMPKPAHPSWEALRTGEPQNQWLEVHGVVRSATNDHFLLKVKGGQLNVRVRPSSPQLLQQWVDATATVRGVYHVIYNRYFQMLSFTIETPGVEYVQIDEPANDPFGMAAQLATNVLRPDSLENLSHRVKVAGVVTSADRASCYVQDQSGVVDVVFAKPGNCRPGDQVEVIGFPEPGTYVPVLVEATLRGDGTATVPSAPHPEMKEILQGGREGQRLSLDAVCLAQSSRGANQVLEMLSERQTFRATLSTNCGLLPIVPAGSRLNISGVCRMDGGNLRPVGQSSASFELMMTSPADVMVRQRPPWWTWRHTVAVVSLMGVILGGAMVWIRTLRNKVAQRTQELQGEIEERKEVQGKLEQQIEERERLEQEKERINKELIATSRQAGMAEVASGVLHNVGNVLNSVNVSASVISEKIRQSKAVNVGKVASMLNAHGDDLGTFLSQDEKGRKLPGYLGALAGIIKQEQDELQSELNGLCSNIDHIKQIVAMQQSYARVSGVVELVAVRDLVEDALKILSGSYSRHAVELKRDYADALSITTDKHKVLQILVNLFQNARHACDESRRSDKEVAVRIWTDDGNKAIIQVSDNGVGISPENLTRIFSHGFSTRPDGHGFGLHSGALAAKELGGKLSVRSDGLGKGAIFTLELPMDRER